MQQFISKDMEWSLALDMAELANKTELSGWGLLPSGQKFTYNPSHQVVDTYILCVRACVGVCMYMCKLS